MKKIISFSIAFLLTAAWSMAQITTPQPSPVCKSSQSVGLTEVSLEFSRPSVKGREIFGGLVPYDKMWRAGANASSKIEFSDKVKLGGVEVPAGKYAFYAMPGKSEWTIVLYKDLSHWGTPSEWDESQEAARFTVKPTKLTNSVESMNIYLDNLRNTSADLNLDWANTRVSMPLEVQIDEKIMADIKRTMAGPSSGDYYRAAGYYLDGGHDLDQALEWINKSTEMQPDAYWIMSKKAEIQARKGDKAGAIATAEKAIKLAKDAGNDGVVMANEALIKELKK